MQKNYRKAFDALSFSPDFQEKTLALLQERAAALEQERRKMKRKTKFLTAAVAAAAVMIVSVSAVVLTLSPADVADRAGDPSLSEAFQTENALALNQVKTFGNYKITLEGMISGKGLSGLCQDVQSDRTYIVFAIESADGTPVDDYPELSYTPLVGGYHVCSVNAWTLRGGYTAFRENGVYYYLFDTESIEMFADHPVYFAIYEGGAPSIDDFSMKKDGTIEMRETVSGAMFTLPLDKSKADPAAAQAFAESVKAVPPLTDEELAAMQEAEPASSIHDEETSILVTSEDDSESLQEENSITYYTVD